MDISGVSMAMSQSKVMDQATIAVMKIAMDTGKENASKITEMLEKVTVNNNIGQNMDSRA